MPGPMLLEEIEQLLVQQYAIPLKQAKELAAQLVDSPVSQEMLDTVIPPGKESLYSVPKLPISPAPLNAAAVTPHHLEDANMSAWQRYSEMLGGSYKSKAMQAKQRDAAMGAASGQRQARPNLNKQRGAE